jgi:uncharacterized membrane protein YphA (DoxX/SURF4 family)
MTSNLLLWTVQTLLAALFLFAGIMKLVVPIEMLAGPVAFPGLFLRFIGVAEVAGGLGLVLPWLLKIRPVLTPVAAAALVVIMVGATGVTLVGGAVLPALIPMSIGVLLGVVAWGRGRAVVAYAH